MRKKAQAIPMYDYTKWESDFGFLILIMNRKLSTAKEYNIKQFGDQLQKPSDYIRDVDIQDIYSELVDDIYETLSDSYKQFLISKYFNGEKKLIEFISENVYDELIKTSIDRNNTKIKKQFSISLTDKITQLNNKEK